MIRTEVHSLNHAFEEAHIWISELVGRGPFENEQQAYSGLRAVLHALRDQLGVEEAVHLAAQLPMVVRGFYFEGWQPAKAPDRERTPEEFYAHVRSSLGPVGAERAAALDLEDATRTIFEYLTERLSEGQVRHVVGAMGRGLRPLWPEAVIG